MCETYEYIPSLFHLFQGKTENNSGHRLAVSQVKSIQQWQTEDNQEKKYRAFFLFWVGGGGGVGGFV